MPKHNKDRKLIGSAQRRETRVVKGLEGELCEEVMKAFGLFILEETEGRSHHSLQ